MKRMTAAEFRRLGLLQELNRRLLHPIGLALEVVVDDDGTERFGEVWDCRDDPEGIIYDDPPTADHEKLVNAMASAVSAARTEALGWFIQPCAEPPHDHVCWVNTWSVGGDCPVHGPRPGNGP